MVIECRGNVKTKSGLPYDSSYCYVCRLFEGKLIELIEYMDTELVTKAFSHPKSNVARNED